MIDHLVFWLSVICACVATTLYIAGCDDRAPRGPEPVPTEVRAAVVPTPRGCPTSRWDETRGCVEAGPPHRITVPECCGRAKRTVR